MKPCIQLSDPTQWTIKLRCRGPICCAATLVALLVSAFNDPAHGQRRLRSDEPPPISLPSIEGDAARCGFSFHDALDRVRTGDATRLASLDRMARVLEPGLTGKWLFWDKSSKALPAARNCAESVVRSGRTRCVRWAEPTADPAKITSAVVPAPTTDERAVLRALDGFVNDRGAVLELGTNGRQYVTLQRFAVEFGTYLKQPRHPALCSGVPEMLNFHSGNLAAFVKRSTEIAGTAARAAQLARQRFDAIAEVRAELARAEVTGTPGGPTIVPVLPGPPTPVTLALAAVDGLLPVELIVPLKQEADAHRLLLKLRDLLAENTLPTTPPALRAAVGATLRMVEAANYGELQVARFKQFERVFLGTIDDVREAHRNRCTCGS